MSRMDNTELPHPKEIDNETLLPAAERRVNSQALLGPDGKVIIDHNGQEYLLRKNSGREATVNQIALRQQTMLLASG